MEPTTQMTTEPTSTTEQTITTTTSLREYRVIQEYYDTYNKTHEHLNLTSRIKDSKNFEKLQRISGIGKLCDKNTFLNGLVSPNLCSQRSAIIRLTFSIVKLEKPANNPNTEIQLRHWEEIEIYIFSAWLHCQFLNFSLLEQDLNMLIWNFKKIRERGYTCVCQTLTIRAWNAASKLQRKQIM